MPAGRPPKYTPEMKKAIVDEICELVSQKQTLHSICKRADIPAAGIIREWLLANPELSANYAKARELRADARADRIDEITEMVIRGQLDPQAARVAIDAEKWLAGKEQPKRYGERIDISAKVESEYSVSRLFATLMPTDCLVTNDPGRMMIEDANLVTKES